MPSFKFQRRSIAYTEFGGGPVAVTAEGGRGRTAKSAPGSRPLILIHGLLLSQEMHKPLARDLAARGNHVITIDLLGHGASDRPRDMRAYSMKSFAAQTIALLDHLEIEEAVVLGTSLGANAALEMAAAAPERLRGMVIEMPVLDNGLLPSALTFTPLLAALTLGEPAMKLLAAAARAVPREVLPYYGNVVLDVVRQEPGPGGAILQGLFFGRVAPPNGARRAFTMPTLVLGHRRDPVHPFTDAGMLADELPNSRLLEANSLVELRLRPERLTAEIAAFLDEIWTSGKGAQPAADGREAKSSAGGTATGARRATRAKSGRSRGRGSGSAATRRVKS
jgi:pimeloyl-ACP methyl ester carboxylesterase